MQIRGMNQFIRLQIEQNVQRIVHLSHQQKLLEDVYAQYLMLRISDSRTQELKQNLVTVIEEYRSNWAYYNKIESEPVDYSFSFLLGLIEELTQSEVLHIEMMPNIKKVEAMCERYWDHAETQFRSSLDGMKTSAVNLRDTISNLRENLIRLSELIGQHAQENGIRMSRSAAQTEVIIILVLLVTAIISLMIAFYVARVLSRPLEALKGGIEQIAIQNFDVHIQNKSKDEIGELGAAFEQMALRLKKNERFKTEMLSQFTHEMKSPLAAIGQAVALLEKTLGPEPSADQKRLISILNGNNHTMGNLITNILHSASYDADTLQLMIGQENITKLFTNTLLKLAPTIKLKNLKVDLNFSREKIECEVDIDKIEEVFYNLLSNAIKFSPQGSTLWVTIVDENGEIRISLKDQGVGIPAKEIPYIFEKMYRASNARKISVKGTGLGLYISSQIIKAHHGIIKVKSRENSGTEFTIILPKTIKNHNNTTVQ